MFEVIVKGLRKEVIVFEHLTPEVEQLMRRKGVVKNDLRAVTYGLLTFYYAEIDIEKDVGQARNGKNAQPGTLLGNMGDPEQLVNNLLDSVFSLLFSRLYSDKNLVLAFDKRLKGYSELSKLVQRLDRWKAELAEKDVGLKEILDNLTILEYGDESELRQGLRTIPDIDIDDPENSIVFTFSPDEYGDQMHAIGRAIRSVCINEHPEISSDSYYPLLEIVTIALVKEIMGYSADEIKDVFDLLGMGQEDLRTMNIEDITEGGNAFLIFSIMPEISRYDEEDCVDRYSRLLKFLQAA